MIRLKLIAIIALIFGPVLAFQSFQDSQRLAKIEKEGVQVLGIPMSGEITERRKSGKSFKLNVSYPDKDGKLHSKEFKVKSDFFEAISEGNSITAETVTIKRLDSDPDQAILVGGSDDGNIPVFVCILVTIGGAIGCYFAFRKKPQA